MGMAASQARYLELTARKTNVEYEGQQVNQQRTALANESAGLFSQLMHLKVPTAPSPSDFTTTQYKFDIGDTNYTITDIKKNPGSAGLSAIVTYYYENIEYTGASRERSDLALTRQGAGTPADPYIYYYGTTRLTAYNEDTDKTALEQIKIDCSATKVGENYAAGQTDKIYSYLRGGTTYYVSLDEMSTEPRVVTSCFAADTTKKVYETSEADLEAETSGRYSKIKLKDFSQAYDLKATTTTDQNAYTDAMNEYEYQQNLYHQQIETINAKTSIIQQQDKTLELKLKQLDTEQEALQTEMDAVKKVIDKNIEQTFKTFS